MKYAMDDICEFANDEPALDLLLEGGQGSGSGLKP